jgi:hypothetical protein
MSLTDGLGSAAGPPRSGKASSFLERQSRVRGKRF